MKRTMILILVLAMTLMGSVALAMPIQSTEGTLAITAAGLDDGAEAELKLKGFQLVALDADGSYVIYANHRFYSVDPAVLKPLLSEAGALEVNRLGTLDTLARGTKNDAAKQLQEALKALGYLDGAADGNFGAGTEGAVKAFQAAEGMEETGKADELMQLLIQSMTAQAVAVEPILDPEVMYAAIAGRTSVDLQPIMESGLILKYDDLSGEGFISDGTEVFFDGSGSADIDKYQLSVRFGLLIREDEQGNVEVLPAAKVSCLCVLRPMLYNLTVKAGASRGNADIESLEATLSGVDSLESGVVLLSDTMVDALAAAEEAGELKLRLTGQYNTFDFAAEDAQLASLAKIGQLALKIRG